MPKQRVGEVLQDRGKLSAAQIENLLEEQSRTQVRFGELLLERKLVDKPDVAEAIEFVSKMKYIDCATLLSDKKALECVPYDVAIRLTALPIRIERSQMVIAMAEPQKVSAVDELRFLTGRDISPRLSFRGEIIPAIAHNYGHAEDGVANSLETKPEIETAPALAWAESADDIEFVSTSSRESNRDAFQEIAAELMHKKTPAVRLISALFTEALHRKASDICIEPQTKEAQVRVRVGGMLSELQSIPASFQNVLISRIKVLADMDISDRRAAQEGEFIVKLGDRCIEVRVSTLPGQYGEKVLLRLLNSGAAALDRRRFGFARHLAEQITQLLSAPQGMLLVTGPTGSAKNTPLYSMLHMLRKPVRNAQLWRGTRHVALLLHYFSDSTLPPSALGAH